MLAESLILGIAGGALALILSSWAVSSLTAMLPDAALPRQQEIGPSLLVFAIAALVAIASAVLAGLPPALQLSRLGITGVLRDGGRTATDHGHRTTRRWLLAVEFALATMLLAGAGLMGRSLLALQAIEPGFDPSNVLALTVPVDGLPQADPLKRAPSYDAVAAALEAVPGVERVGAINHLPLAGDTWRFRFGIEGRPEPPPSERPGATWRVVRPGYFEAMRLPVRGRTFTNRDGLRDLPVVIINQSLAARHFAGEDPIGRRIRVGSDDGEWMTVVGVSANARQSEWSGPVPEEVYVAVRAARGRVWRRRAHVRPSHGGRPGRGRIGGQPCRVDRGSRCAHCAVDDDGARRHRSAVARTSDSVAAGRLRGRRGAAGRDRDLWTDCLCRLAPHARDRHPDGAWRTERRRGEACARRDDRASRGRCPGGMRRVAGFGARRGLTAVRRDTSRPADLRCGRGRARSRRVGRGVDPVSHRATRIDPLTALRED